MIASRMEDAVSDPPNSQHRFPGYFFFHCSDQDKLYEENSFYNTKSLEELEREWLQRRAAMKEGFRRRRKDARKKQRTSVQ